MTDVVAELKSKLGGHDLVLPVLTDEELATVTGPDVNGRRLVDLPAVEKLEPAARAAALSSGKRSLIARGLMTPLALDSDESPVAADNLMGTLPALLAVRHQPNTVAMIERFWMARTVRRYLYGSVELGAVLDEEVDDVGMHGFILRSPGSAARSVAGFVDPEEFAREDSDPVVRYDNTAPEWVRVTRAVERATAVTRFFWVVAKGGEEREEIRMSITAEPENLWVLSGYRTAEGGARPGETQARTVSKETLVSLLTGIFRLDQFEG